jgi:lactobin A/cerein 7B family class IIb bacteriocin
MNQLNNGFGAIPGDELSALSPEELTQVHGGLGALAGAGAVVVGGVAGLGFVLGYTLTPGKLDVGALAQSALKAAGSGGPCPK